MRFAYTGIRVKDMEESLRFYTEKLGMKLVGGPWKNPATKGAIALLQSLGSGQILELNHYEPGSPYATAYTAGEGLDHLGFKVTDVKATFEALRSKGVEAALEPSGDIKAPLAFLKDPNGIWIELFQYSEEIG